MQLLFPTKEAAEAELQKRKGVKSHLGEVGMMMSDFDKLQFVEARNRLLAVGSNINEAVAFFLKHAKPARESIHWDALVELCVRGKEDQNCDRRYIAQMRSVARGFSNAGFGLAPVHGIVKQNVEGWLRANQWAPRTWNNYLTDLRTIFEWGRAEGYLTLNPCEGVPRKKLNHHEEIAFLTVKQCKALLDRAAALRPGTLKRDEGGQWIKYELADECFRDVVPMVVVGLFCGLRPEKELGRMTWDNVKIDSSLVVVTAGRAKSRRRRTVELSANALAWLEWCRQGEVCDMGDGAKVCPKNLKRRWKRLREACKLFDAWPHDALRHTFATYHYAAHQNEAKLQVLMGHRNAQMLHEHYRGLATPQEAAAFWGLMPPIAK